jgi:hypothetical protein
MTGKMSACLRLVLIFTVLSELGVFQVDADYDNHWAFYYETPCCGHHHLRHHKGENSLTFIVLCICYPVVS